MIVHLGKEIFVKCLTCNEYIKPNSIMLGHMAVDRDAIDIIAKHHGEQDSISIDALTILKHPYYIVRLFIQALGAFDTDFMDTYTEAWEECNYEC